MRRTHQLVRGAILAMGLAAMTRTASASLVIHWNLDELAGQTAADSAAAGGAQNGTSGNGAPQWQPGGGIIGGALRFSPTAQADTDENVTHTAGANIIGAYPISIGTWVKTSSNAAFRETFAYLGNPGAADQYLQTSKDPSNVTPASRAVAAARNPTFNGAAGGSAINDDAWHHVVGVYTSATSRTLYVDGRAVATNATSTNLPAVVTRFSIGALMRPAATDAFAGLLDDVGLWDEALTPTRIALLNGLGRFSSVALDDASIPQVEAVFTSQGGTAQAGAITWEYATALPSTTIGATGTTAGGAPFIVLDASGNGVQAVPEPAGAAAMALVAAVLGRRRRRA